MTEWAWERTNALNCGAAGDVAKLFKNEGTKQPGVFAVGAPTAEATLMAREVIQNSWDAARELRDEMGPAAPEFAIDFHLSRVVGEKRANLIHQLGLQSLGQQLGQALSNKANTRNKLGLRSNLAIESLDDGEPLATLVIREHGTTGMYGPFWKPGNSSPKSKMYFAMISVGFTMKAAGSGGSYGYGKAGLIAASGCRTVVAYSCFKEQADDPGVTRRLLGMTYWGPYEMGNESFTGFARFGASIPDGIIPFENEEADEKARALGLDVRNADHLSDLGTTFLLVDPVIEPDDLCVAISRNWWPAIMDNETNFSVKVTSDRDGQFTEHPVRPRRDSVLQSFIRAWELATTPQDNQIATESRKDLGVLSKKLGELPVGQLGVVADLGSWSYAQAEEGDPDAEELASVKHTSMVALVRGPQMVVEYYDGIRGQQPFVRGAFIASPEIDDLLRQTEPKAHDSWQRKPDGDADGVDDNAYLVSGEVTKRIGTAVQEFRKKLKPPPPDPGDVRLPEFQELFRRLMDGKAKDKPKPPPHASRNVQVHIPVDRVVAAPDGASQLFQGKVVLALSPNYKKSDIADVEVRLTLKFIEDGGAGSKWPLNVIAPVGFIEVGVDRYRGKLGREGVPFEIESDPYSADWSARFAVSCDLLKPAAPSTDESFADVNETGEVE